LGPPENRWAHPVVGWGRHYLRDPDVLHSYDVRRRESVLNCPEFIAWDLHVHLSGVHGATPPERLARVMAIASSW